MIVGVLICVGVEDGPRRVGSGVGNGVLVADGDGVGTGVRGRTAQPGISNAMANRKIDWVEV